MECQTETPQQLRTAHVTCTVFRRANSAPRTIPAHCESDASAEPNVCGWRRAFAAWTKQVNVFGPLVQACVAPCSSHANPVWLSAFCFYCIGHVRQNPAHQPANTFTRQQISPPTYLPANTPTNQSTHQSMSPSTNKAISMPGLASVDMS